MKEAYLMELDPRYVDVIIARWEAFTGEVAVKISGNDTAVVDDGGNDNLKPFSERSVDEARAWKKRRKSKRRS